MMPIWNNCYVGAETKTANNPLISVSQNYPNPFHGITSIGIVTRMNGDLSIGITNPTGQKLISINKGIITAGSYRYNIDCNQLSAGVYFYTIKVGNESITKKMIVD